MSLPGTRHETLPGFEGATGWLNSEPLSPEGLRGKVVLVDFWTYTCINWLRTLGYVRAWWEKYTDRGPVLVGVHTPEFPFEHDVDNVREAAKEMRVEYPIALDSDYGVWRAFDNHYWPAVYIADTEGRIRHHHFGEGGYEECERVVQRLLGLEDELLSPALEGFEAQADWANLQSPETYLGYEQAQNFVDADGAELKLNQWALSGDWTVEGGKSVLNRAGGESHSASTRVTSISSWGRPHGVSPCRSACSWTANLPPRLTAWTSTTKAAEPWRNNGCIS
jgi:hypothetical protein